VVTKAFVTAQGIAEGMKRERYDQAKRRRMVAGHMILGISGASGACLGLRAIELFAQSPDVEMLHLVVSPRAIQVARDEISPAIRTAEDLVSHSGLPAERHRFLSIHPEGAVGAPISSGSFKTRGMAVLPCSAGTLGSIANGISRGLLQRAADVCLKERRRLILGFRETPYSEIHAENILRVTRAGAIVAPPVPAFYATRTTADMLDAYLLRVADLLDIRIDTKDYRWTGTTAGMP
jgi:4-hydroxy-3-polyprenylbenzoate decarboxylase